MRRDKLLLLEMIDAGVQAMALADGIDVDALAADRVRRDALLWNFTVLGEAATQLPAAFKAAHPDVDWVRPARMRKRIVHGYWSLDLDILLATATNDLPRYVVQLRCALGTLVDSHVAVSVDQQHAEDGAAGRKT